MTEREKIIELVKKCEGYVYKDGDAVFDSTEDIEAFYRAAQAEAFEQPDLVAEIERLKAENRELNYQANTERGAAYEVLRQQLSAAQADNEQLVKALEVAAEQIRRCDYTPARSTLLQAITTHKARKEKP